MKYSLSAYLLLSLVWAQNAEKQFNLLLDSINTLKNKRQYNIAIETGKQAMSFAEKQWGQDTHYSKALYLTGRCYHASNQMKEALNYYQEDSVLRKKIYSENSIPYAVILNDMGILYYDIAMYKPAEALFLQVLTIRKEILGDQHIENAAVLANLANTYNQQSAYQKAEAFYKQSIQIWEKNAAQNDFRYANTINNLGNLYKNLNKFEPAESLYLQSASLRKQIFGEKHSEYANSLNSLGVLYTDMGKYVLAESLLNRTIKLKKELFGTNHLSYAMSLNNLAGLYIQLSKNETAESLITESSNIIKEKLGENHPYYLTTINNLAILYRDKPDQDKLIEAERLHKQVAEATQLLYGVNHPIYLERLYSLGALYEYQGRYFVAKSIFQQIMKTFEEGNMPKDMNWTKVAHALAIIYMKTGNYDSAGILLEQNKQIVNELFGNKHPALKAIINTTGNVAYMSKDFQKADSIYDKLNEYIILYLKEIFPILTEQEKKNYLESIIGSIKTYYNMADRLPNSVTKCYNNILLIKGLVLQSNQKIRKKILTTSDTTLKTAFSEWLTKKNNLANYYNLTKSELKQKNINIDSLEQDIKIQEQDLSKKSNALDELFVKIVQWQDIQQKLKPNEAAVEIVRYNTLGTTDITDTSDTEYFNRYQRYPTYHPLNYTDSTNYLVMILRSTGKPQMVILPGAELEQKGIKNYLQFIRKLKIDTLSYSIFWEPIQQKLKDIQTVYVSPDGVYHQINLNTLYNTKNKKYIGQQLQIVQLVSTRDLLINQEHHTANNNIYLFGNPQFDNDTAQAEDRGFFSDLPGAAAEVEQISKIEGLQTVLKTGAAVTETAVKSVYNPAVLHIATHGYYEKNITSDATDEITLIKKKQADPMLRSGLLLSGGGSFIASVERGASRNAATTDTDDGILTAFEAQNLRLDSTELVVLSACQTGVGEVVTGEGVYGLQRAFQIAGAKYLIMSLWNVNDETTRLLMTTFYKEWAKTKDIRKSFELAQNTVRNKYPEPKYWGAFVLLGK